MPCTSPLKGFKDSTGALSFSSRGSKSVMSVACGQCMDCRIDRSRAWAIRCVHESQKHLENCFITLTYAPDHLPPGGTLVKKHFQDFMKRLRKSLGNRKVSFFHCGEYGEQLSRPHYHALIFGYDFQDKKPWKKSHDGSQLFTSAALEKLWAKGFCSIGAVTYQTAAYCSAYVLKKITGDLAESHYGGKQPEYITMSLRPAIGKDWINIYNADVYPGDTVVMQGRETKPPRYYDKILKKNDPELHDKLKLKRRLNRTTKQVLNATPKRLKVRATITSAKINLFKRNLE